MELVEKYFGDGSQSSIEARVYLENYMVRVREFFIVELGGTDEALDELTYRLALSRSNFAPKVAKQRLYQYERNRAIFVDHAINGKSFVALGRKYGVSKHQSALVVKKTLFRLKKCDEARGACKVYKQKRDNACAVSSCLFGQGRLVGLAESARAARFYVCLRE